MDEAPEAMLERLVPLIGKTELENFALTEYSDFELPKTVAAKA